MKTKEEYIAPSLTVVTFKTEQGFALSNGNGPDNAFLGFISTEDNYNEQAQENWHENNLFGNSW